MTLALIWAQAHGGVIGKDGTMPWHVPEDMAHFKELTMDHPVVMGRRTWESFPERFRPLPGRRNIVITRSEEWEADGAERASSVESALALAASSSDLTWVIGGGQVYAATIAGADILEVTEIDETYVGDAFAPAIGESWTVIAADPKPGPDGTPTWHTSRLGPRYRFLTYARTK